MYDSSRKMVSSTWFSAESNLQWERTTVRVVTETDPGNLEKKELFLVCAPTCWYEVVRRPAVAFQAQWSSPQLPSAAQARPHWPAEMPEWPRFAGISPADAYQSSRKPIKHEICAAAWVRKLSKLVIWGHRDEENMRMMDWLALFGLKQASFYEVGNCLWRENITEGKTIRKEKKPHHLNFF